VDDAIGEGRARPDLRGAAATGAALCPVSCG